MRPPCSSINGPQPATVQPCHPSIARVTLASNWWKDWLQTMSACPQDTCWASTTVHCGPYQASGWSAIASLVAVSTQSSPNDLYCVEWNVKPYSTQPALNGNLFLPRTCRKFRDRAFAVAAPRVSNSLPTDIKLHQLTTTYFKRRLKTVLFNRSFAEHM